MTTSLTLHPEMANFYRRQVHELDELLQHGPEAARLKAADMLRALISAIVLTPNIERLEVDVQGDLAGILAIASNAKSPRPDGQGLSQLKVVAGTRFHLNLRPFNALPLLPPELAQSQLAQELINAIA